MDEVSKLAVDAIKRALELDLFWHCQEGCGSYEMDDELIALVRRAQAMGLGPLEPFEGYSYLSQAAL